MIAIAAIVGLLLLHTRLDAQSVDRSAMGGPELYQAACAACHGSDGRGQPIAVRGFDIDPPDFTDCSLTTPEADLDWLSVIHQGGPARAFDRMMPAFGDELTEAQIGRVIDHIRTLCVERGWPRGDLNFPRTFFTEKAFPENETVWTTGVTASGAKSVTNELVFEHRIGARGQYEVKVPIDFQQGDVDGSWVHGLGDIELALRRTLYASVDRGAIVAAGAAATLPTGKEDRGLGNGFAVFEPFAMYGQRLATNGFLQLHAGYEIPSNHRKAGANELPGMAAQRFHARAAQLPVVPHAKGGGDAA